MLLAEAIERNRIREARYDRAERVLRRIRQRIFDYEDMGPEQYAKARRVMATCQRIAAPRHEARRRAAAASKLERTPSAFEPGCAG